MLTVGDQVIPPPELAGGRGGRHPRSPDLEGGRQRNVAWGMRGQDPELVEWTPWLRTVGN